MHVLLVFEQGAMQRRDELGRVFLAQRFGRHVLVQEKPSQSSSSLVDGFFFRPGTSRI